MHRRWPVFSLAAVLVVAVLFLLLEQGFEVAVVKDGTAAAKLPDYDGYKAALVNYRFIANAVWTTEEVKQALAKMNPCNPCGGKKMENPCNPCSGKK